MQPEATHMQLNVTGEEENGVCTGCACSVLSRWRAEQAEGFRRRWLSKSPMSARPPHTSLLALKLTSAVHSESELQTTEMDFPSEFKNVLKN